ncbi:MAG TPA: OmpA family protein [Terriglobales bacterium]|jgi:outer membrane protein OmpA-like peptidoglycan-associated protein|nr:OmpA family protein [Terriglobales bacterium]
MNRTTVFALVIAASLPLSVGCASKKYVRNETAPTINKVNELDDLTAKTTRDIKDVDTRSQQGIQSVQAAAAAADQKALSAGQAASQAQTMATTAVNRADSLTGVVANLDNYRPVVETQVHFGFDKFVLTPKAKKALDELGGELPNAKHYIVVVDGNTDSVGSADYNYLLSKRRADSVISYLVSKYQVPAHKIYIIGMGKDKPVAPNSNTAGRAKNRRVDVRLMTNINDQAPTSASAATQQ